MLFHVLNCIYVFVFVLGLGSSQYACLCNFLCLSCVCQLFFKRIYVYVYSVGTYLLTILLHSECCVAFYSAYYDVLGCLKSICWYSVFLLQICCEHLLNMWNKLRDFVDFSSPKASGRSTVNAIYFFILKCFKFISLCLKYTVHKYPFCTFAKLLKWECIVEFKIVIVVT